MTVGGDEAIRRAAANWIARLRSGTVSEGDRHRFDAWRLADPRHEETYERLARTMDRTAFLAHTTVGRERDLGLVARVRSAPSGAIAAGIACVILAGGVWYGNTTERAPPSPVRAGGVSIASRPDAVRAVRLSDGSTVMLGKASLLRIAFTPSERYLELDRGRARFTVAHDATRPFVVSAASVSVVAVATVFEVKVDRGKASIAAIDGAVIVRGREPSARRDQTLQAGERLTVEAKQHFRASSPEATARATPAMLEFDGRPVAEAIAAMNRTSDVRLVLEDHAVANRRMTGAFHAGDAEGLADAITAMFGLRQPVRSGAVLRIAPRRS